MIRLISLEKTRHSWKWVVLAPVLAVLTFPTNAVFGQTNQRIKPMETKPIATQRIATKPIVAKPIATKHLATQPIATKHIATQPIATKRIATKPMATRPMTVKPVKRTQ